MRGPPGHVDPQRQLLHAAFLPETGNRGMTGDAAEEVQYRTFTDRDPASRRSPGSQQYIPPSVAYLSKGLDPIARASVRYCLTPRSACRSRRPEYGCCRGGAWGVGMEQAVSTQVEDAQRYRCRKLVMSRRRDATNLGYDLAIAADRCRSDSQEPSAAARCCRIAADPHVAAGLGSSAESRLPTFIESTGCIP